MNEKLQVALDVLSDGTADDDVLMWAWMSVEGPNTAMLDVRRLSINGRSRSGKWSGMSGWSWSWSRSTSASLTRPWSVTSHGEA